MIVGLWGCELSLALLALLVVWTVAIGTTMVVARNRLGPVDPSVADELLSRGLALASATVTLGILGGAGALFTASTDILLLVPVVWLVAVAPLAVPRMSRPDGTPRFNSMNMVVTSVMLSAAGGPVLALFVLVRLIMTNPEII